MTAMKMIRRCNARLSLLSSRSADSVPSRVQHAGYLGKLCLAIVAASVFTTNSLARNEAPRPADSATSSTDKPVAVIDAPPISVKSVHPKRDAELAIHVEQPATVAAYYQASLYAEISGTVTFLEKAIGHVVHAGEPVAVIRPIRPNAEDTKLGSLVSPFTGVIASRSVDPGAFVPSATIVPGVQPLVTIERNDIVTISAQMPDSVAHLIGKETEAELFLDTHSAGPLRCRLTRIAPSLNPADRTLRVEVDLYNRTKAEFGEFMASSETNQHAELKGREPPQFPGGLAEGEAANLIPGGYGRMRLTVKRLAGVFLIPSSAIVRFGGMPFLYRIEAKTARKAPIAINLDDGALAHVVWLEKVKNVEVRRELNEVDEIVLSNQGELEDGQPVQSQVTPW